MVEWLIKANRSPQITSRSPCYKSETLTQTAKNVSDLWVHILCVLGVNFEQDINFPHLSGHIQLLGILRYIQSNTFHLVSAGKEASRYLVLNLLKPGMLHFVPLKGTMI